MHTVSIHLIIVANATETVRSNSHKLT